MDAGCRLCTSAVAGEWVLSFQDGGQPSEGAREALLALGNGYVASRGAAAEASADGTHYPGTYVAGFYNRLVSNASGRTRDDESLVNLPNWLPLTFRPAGGAWLSPGAGTVLHEHLALDLRRGVLSREIVVVDKENRRTRLRQRRLVSMAAPHVVALESSITAENWSGRLDVRSALDGRVSNGNSAASSGLASQHLNTIGTGTDRRETVWLVAEATGSMLRVAQAARTRVHCDGQDLRPDRRPVAEQSLIGQDLGIDVRQGKQITVDKVVTIFTSRDRAIYTPLTAAQQELADAGTFDELLAAHACAWDSLWRRFHLGLNEGQEVTLAVNTNLFHLLQTLSPHTADLDVGVPARGLHGEGYHGHVFWDELFVFPFLNLRLPELTRALLQYRHRRLPQARRRAAALGAKGALFPWQSGSDGREESPIESVNPRTGRWMADHSSRQYHINLAVAYNVWRYWQTTADIGFLAVYGAELITETARFWASLATYDPSTDRYDIRGVMGPDEFHDGYPDRPGQGIDNSAYVNIMTAWALTRACDVHQILRHHDDDQLWQSLQLTDDELSTWEHIATRLRLSFLPNGVIEQFEGYRDLAELDWDGYRRRYGDIQMLGLILDAENDSANRYQASKQADVLMLLYLFSAEELTARVRRLGYDFDPATIPATVEHYLARTCHGSALSRVAHAWVLARTNRRGSWHMLRDALGSDLTDIQGGTTREGIHLGAIGGALDILQRCYTGLDTRDDVLWLNPLLPHELHRLDFDIRYRGQWIKVCIDHPQITLQALPCTAAPTTIAIRDMSYQLAPGMTISVPSTDSPTRGEVPPEP
jgi:trehalose/maltose hydrolase-like predicted phosphorylase